MSHQKKKKLKLHVEMEEKERPLKVEAVSVGQSYQGGIQTQIRHSCNCFEAAVEVQLLAKYSRYIVHI